MREYQKRPIHMAREAYWVCACVKRDLFTWQKKPIGYALVSKETYVHGKRSLLGMRLCQKRLTAGILRSRIVESERDVPAGVKEITAVR